MIHRKRNSRRSNRPRTHRYSDLPQPQQQRQAYQQPSRQSGPPQPPGGPPGQPAPRGSRPVSTATATGLILGICALVLAAVLLVAALTIPSAEDYSLTNLDTGGDTQATDSAAATYGEVPASVLENVNTAATAEEYYGNYAGKVSFRNENIGIMGELYGDTEESAILSSVNGKTYNCTAMLDEYYLDMYSTEVPMEMLESDGSFYYIYYDIENGASLYEDSGYDDEMMMTYRHEGKRLFLERRQHLRDQLRDGSV